eukprot:6187258-Pleurochrysis_carterae.AAC.3
MAALSFGVGLDRSHLASDAVKHQCELVRQTEQKDSAGCSCNGGRESESEGESESESESERSHLQTPVACPHKP